MSLRPEPLTPDSRRVTPPSNPSPEGSRSFFRRRFIDPLVRSKNPPWFDARGVAVGLFIGLGIPLGAQMVLLGLLRLAMRFNAAIAFAFTWVNNPFSVIPMYYGYYCLGSRVLGKPVALNCAGFRAMLKPVLDAGYFWESLSSFAYLGKELVLRWSVGALLVATVCAVVGYVVGYTVQKARSGRHKEQRGKTGLELVQPSPGSDEEPQDKCTRKM